MYAKDAVAGSDSFCEEKQRSKSCYEQPKVCLLISPANHKKKKCIIPTESNPVQFTPEVLRICFFFFFSQSL